MESTGTLRHIPVDAESERAQHMSALLELLHDAVLFVRLPDRMILDVNPAALRMFGCAREDLVGRSSQTIHVDREAFDKFGAMVAPAIRRGEGAMLDVELRRKDGSRFPAQLTVSPIRGESMTIVGVVRDMTAARQAEAARAEAESLWRSVVEHAHDWFYVADRSGKILFINRGRPGVTEDQILGRSLFEWLSADDASRVRPIYDGVFATARPATFITEGLVGREARHFECRVAPVLRDGHVVAASVTSIDITERVRTEAQLQRTTRNLEDFVETSAIGLHWVGPDGRILWANAADYEPLGYTREEYIGHDIREFHADAPVIADILACLGRDQSIQDYPARLKAKDGSIHHVLIDSSVYRENGKFVHTRCFTRDVTAQVLLQERERVHAATVETLARLQAQLASSLDIEAIAQAAVDAATRLAGAAFGVFVYTSTDARGERATSCALSGTAPALADATLAANPAALEALPARSRLSVPVVSRDGTLHGTLFLGHPEAARFSKDDEDVVAAVAGQSASAIDNATLLQRAKQSEERWRSVVENAPAQIVTIDATGRVLSVNRRLGKGETSDALGKSIYAAIGEKDRERVRDVIERVMRDRTPGEYEASLGSGDAERWFSVRVAPLEEGAVLIVADVTERKRAEDEISQVRAQLIQGEKLAALGSLVSGVAHELRTPLTFLANNAFLLERRLLAGAQEDKPAKVLIEDVKPFLRELTSGVDRINQLVEDLRKYTKARLSSQKDVASLDVLLAEAVELFRATNRGSHPVERSLCATAPVRANRGAIQQLVLNLLQNAADASQPGRAIRIVTREDGLVAILEVTDQGEGIPESVQERMFEPLYTTKVDGTGLGLSIVRRIADDHGATIEVVSALGRGTTFRVRFPFASLKREPEA